MPTTRGHTSVGTLLALAKVDTDPSRALGPRRLLLNLEDDDAWQTEWSQMTQWKKWGMNVESIRPGTSPGAEGSSMQNDCDCE